MDIQNKQKHYQYIPNIDFYPKQQKYAKQIKIKGNTIYMYSQFNKEMLIIQLFVLNGQQKIMKKQYLQLNYFQFMNQSREIVNFYSRFIQIWRLDHKYNYAKQTIMEDQYNYILQFVISWNDDLIVSSTLKGALFFCKKQLDWKCYQILQGKWGSLKNLNLSQKGDILIATNNKAIFLFQCNSDDNQNEWSLKEAINKECEELCFIDDATFGCISNNDNVLTIYEVSAKRKSFQTYNLSGIPNSYIQLFEYIQQKQLLLVKRDNTLFLIQLDFNGKYALEQKLMNVPENRPIVFSKNGDYMLEQIQYQFDKVWRKIQLRRFIAVY